jgi:hypothetical protein
VAACRCAAGAQERGSHELIKSEQGTVEIGPSVETLKEHEMKIDEKNLTAAPVAVNVEDWLIRDLVETYPMTMTVLAPLGIDLCCGGGHPLGEALRLHGLDRDEVLPKIIQVITASATDEG